MSKQIESVAYHEAGHMTAAVVQSMPLRESGLHVDLNGHGSADFFARPEGDLGMTEADDRDRKFTIIALQSAHMAQLRFYPDCQQDAWQHDLGRIERLTREMYTTGEEGQIAIARSKERAKRLVDDHWPIIAELAKTLLSKACTPMSHEDTRWGSGSTKHHMRGAEIVEFFAAHNIPAKVIDDGVIYDSTQDVPHYDSLA
jgi:hypothetical protein